MLRPDRVNAIIRNVAREHGVSTDDILGRGKTVRVSTARAEAISQCRQLIEIAGKPPSYPQIGQWFGLDHSSVIHACKRFPADEQLSFPWDLAS